MFNRLIILGLCIGGDVCGKAAEPPKAIMSLEINQQRLMHSGLTVSPNFLRQDRHKFLLARLNLPKLNEETKREIMRQESVKTVSVNLLEKSSSKGNQSMKTVVEHKPTAINWTMKHPVNGTLRHRFGEGEEKLSRGIVYQVKANQSVCAPVEGKIIFSGPIKGFENVVMIEKDLESTILVAGISNSEIKKDDRVFRGQRIGDVIKSGWIYLEVRKAGISLDPQKNLVSGSINEE